MASTASDNVRKDYRALRDKTAAFIDNYDKLAELVYNAEELAKRREAMATRKHQLDTKEFSLVVIGEMKHGKSTFLNAMLRKPVFPKDVREATAAVTFLRHNDTIKDTHPEWRDKAVVEFNGRPTQVVDHLDLGKYTTCLNKGEINVAEDVKCVTIYSDSPFVEDGVSVVDTPGMNTPNAQHEQITRNQIDLSHAAVFLFKAGEAGKKSDYEFLESTVKKIERFFFVVNRIDEVGGIGDISERVIADLKQKVKDNPVLGPKLAAAHFYPTSGLQALLARYPDYFPNEKFGTREIWERECNPPERRQALEAASGMTEFETALLDFLFRGERTREFLRSHLTFFRGAVDDARRYVREQKDALQKKVDIKELEQKKKVLEAEFERERQKVESTSSELTDKLVKAMSEFVEDCETDKETKLSEFREHVSEIQEYSAMRSVWDDFTGEVERTAMRFASQAQMDMKDVAQRVFCAVDFKVRGELNKRLGKANLFEMPKMEAPKIEWVVPEAVAKDVEERLSKISNELEEVETRLSETSGTVIDVQEAMRRKEDLEKERLEAGEELRSKMQMLGTRPGIEQKMVSPEHDTQEWRGGALGVLGNILFGKKTVHHPAEFEPDDSAQKKYDAALAALNKREEEMKAELRKRLEDARASLSAAQREQAEREHLARIQQNKQAKENELRRELRERQQQAENAALVKMKATLCRAMETQLAEVIENLRAMTSNCSQWAMDYIGGIQSELSAAVATRHEELENLSKSLTLKKKDREAQLAKLEEAEKMVKALILDAEALTTDIDLMA